MLLETCNWKPLKLEEGGVDTFLETKFYVQDNVAHYRLKNDNENGKKIWRYHDYSSYGSYVKKRATMFNCLRKVAKSASDEHQLFYSALAKLKEFEQLNYPVGIRRFACTILARDTGNDAWLQVRSRQ